MYNKAVQTVNSIQTNRCKTELISNIAESLYNNGLTGKAESLYNEAIQIAHKEPYGDSRFEIMRGIIKSLKKVGLRDKAEKLSNEIPKKTKSEAKFNISDYFN